MDSQHLKNLLQQVQSGQLDLDAALHQLKKLPFEDLGYAKVDFHRCMRAGVPEVIYCEGKTNEQIHGIASRLAQYHDNILQNKILPANSGFHVISTTKIEHRAGSY